MTTAAPVRPNDVALELTGRDYISYSALNTYAACPLRYKFRYIDQLPEATVASSLAFGGGIHSGIEFHFNELMTGNPPPDQDALLGAFWDGWRERAEQAVIRFGKHESLDSVGHLADRVLSSFRESTLAHPLGTVLGVEEEFRAQLSPQLPDLLARLDLIVEIEDGLVVRDWKTSRSRWRANQADDQADQLLLYAEIVRRSFPGRTIKLEFAVLTKGETPRIDIHQVPFRRSRVERVTRVAERIWRGIELGIFFPAPSAMSCPSCPFREPCRAWQG